MLGEIIQELTKIHENEEITSENVLSWAKRVEVQRAQSAIMNSLTDIKEFNKLKVVKNMHKDSPRRPTQTKILAKQMCKYCGNSHPQRQCLACEKRCTECSTIGHFRVVFRSRRARVMNEVEQEAAQGSAKENNIDSVHINPIHFNKNHSLITVNLKTSTGPNNVMVPYKVDTGSDGNIMPFHIYKKLFPKITNEQLVATKNNNILLKMYKKTTVTQLGTCTVEVEHKNNKKKCRSFVVPRNRHC